MDFNRFVSHRLEAFRDRPRMWGSTNETIEALALQLLEVEIRHYQPEVYNAKARVIMDLYTQELGRRYGSGSAPLYTRTPELYDFEPKVRDFDQALFEICHKVRATIRAELGLDPPFEVLPIHRLEHTLWLHFPTAMFVLTAPLRPEGAWTLDVTHKGLWITLTWMAPDHFSVSSTKESVYGEGPDEVFSDYNKALTCSKGLLSEKGPQVSV